MDARRLSQSASMPRAPQALAGADVAGQADQEMLFRGIWVSHVEFILAARGVTVKFRRGKALFIKNLDRRVKIVYKSAQLTGNL
jgi:hypothetical protein